MDHSFDELLSWLRTDKAKFKREFKPTKPLDEPRGVHGETLLHYCVVEGWASEVECLLALGADPDSRSKYESTPLMDAATMGYEPLVKLLLRAGANPNSRDQIGETAMDKLTLVKKHPNIQRLLMDSRTGSEAEGL